MATLSRLREETLRLIQYESLVDTPSTSEIDRWINEAYQLLASQSELILATAVVDVTNGEVTTVGTTSFRRSIDMNPYGLKTAYQVALQEGTQIRSLARALYQSPDVTLSDYQNPNIRLPEPLIERRLTVPTVHALPSNYMALIAGSTIEWFQLGARLFLVPPIPASATGSLHVLGSFIPTDAVANPPVPLLNNPTDRAQVPDDLAVWIPTVAYALWARHVPDLLPHSSQIIQNALVYADQLRQKRAVEALAGVPNVPLGGESVGAEQSQPARRRAR